MGKVGNYIVGASVVAVMAGSLASAEVQENVTNNNENGNKIEYVQDNLRDELKNDSTVAWETVVSNDQQLVYMLANAEPLSKEDQNKMVTEQDRVVADKVLDHMENKNHKEEYFTLNYKE